MEDIPDYDVELAKLLVTATNQIFVALEERLLGKVFVCFTDSKKWNMDCLLECYTLKFSYTGLGDFHIYVDRAGAEDRALKENISTDVFKSLKQSFSIRAQLPDIFYTQLFVSSVDYHTELKGAWAGNGHGVREALLRLKWKKGSGSSRVGKFESVR
ncbi:translation initiation factor eIF5A [Diaporthe australafricana]|uniref:Translation initiation factor eIF5A n=1 Tax=Diaporthe australafricana TaxID=127596 RepID=A0ABR3W532_9PEZI